MGVLSGNKFNDSHQSYVKGIEPILLALKESEFIKKIFLGEIARIKPGVRHFSVRSIEGNVIHLSYRDVTSVQLITVVASDIEGTKLLLSKILEEHKLKNPNNKSKPIKKKKLVGSAIQLTPDGRIFKQVNSRGPTKHLGHPESPSPKLGDLFSKLVLNTKEAEQNDTTAGNQIKSEGG